MLAAIQGEALIKLVIWVLIIGLICWLLLWLVDYVALSEPFAKIAKVIVACVAVIFLINALLTLVGKPFIEF